MINRFKLRSPPGSWSDFSVSDLLLLVVEEQPLRPPQVLSGLGEDFVSAGREHVPENSHEKANIRPIE